MGTRIVAITSRNPERAADVAKSLKLSMYRDWRELVAREDVDLVSVVTPPATHMEMTLAHLSMQGSALREPMAMNARKPNG